MSATVYVSLGLGSPRRSNWVCCSKIGGEKQLVFKIPKLARTRSLVREVPSATIENDDQEDEFEAYTTSGLGEFKGTKGLGNFQIRQERDVLSVVYDFYTFVMKQKVTGFVTAMVAAPVLLSMVFTVFYLPAYQGLALQEERFHRLDPLTLFQMFMFSMSLCTGLEPAVKPVSPYTLVLANVNALVAQLLFTFLSGAVFARLSQPSLPIKCSSVAVISQEKPKKRHRVLMVRYVLSGPQPSELVDVRVELTYKYDTPTSSSTFFRGTQPLKLVRKENFYINHGMLVRHVIDENSPLYRRTPEMLEKEDAVISLSVVGFERSSMQPVFHVQHYCAFDGQIVWDAEFEDMILINKKNMRVVDHSRLSSWRRITR